VRGNKALNLVRSKGDYLRNQDAKAIDVPLVRLVHLSHSRQYTALLIKKARKVPRTIIPEKTHLVA